MKRTRLVLAVSGVAVLGIFGAAYWWMQSPVTNKGVSVTPEPNNVLASQIELTALDTTYFSTKLPSYMVRKTTAENQSAPATGMYLFKHAQLNLSDQLGITTGPLTGTLSELSGIKVRQSEPERYSQTTRDDMPPEAVVFQRQDQYETAVFWADNGKYASVVVGGSAARSADLQQMLNSVVKNWQWR